MDIDPDPDSDFDPEEKKSQQTDALDTHSSFFLLFIPAFPFTPLSLLDNIWYETRIEKEYECFALLGLAGEDKLISSFPGSSLGTSLLGAPATFFKPA